MMSIPGASTVAVQIALLAIAAGMFGISLTRQASDVWVYAGMTFAIGSILCANF